MKNKIIFISAIALLAVVASCGKKTTPVSDYPTLTISTPHSNDSDSTGTVIHITGTAVASASDDSHSLHELSLTVKRLSDGWVAFRAMPDVHDSVSAHIDTFFTAPAVTATTNFMLYDSLSNHMYKFAIVDVPFSVHP